MKYNLSEKKSQKNTTVWYHLYKIENKENEIKVLCQHIPTRDKNYNKSNGMIKTRIVVALVGGTGWVMAAVGAAREGLEESMRV